MNKRYNPIERFFNKVKKTESCWLWIGCRSSGGYGNFRFNKKCIVASRFMYFIKKGPIPYGMNVCHKCDNPDCVNPGHLFLGTQKENVTDMIKKGRYYCGVPNRGEDCPASILRKEEVLEIRRLSKLGIRQREIATKFNIKQANISNIVTRKSWRHI